MCVAGLGESLVRPAVHSNPVPINSEGDQSAFFYQQESLCTVLWIQIPVHWILIRIQVRIKGYTINFKRKNKNNFDEKYFLKTKYRYRYIFKEILTQLSLWIVNFHLKSYTFLPPFYPIYTVLVWIRFRIRNTDPDPDSPWIRLQYGSGSTTLVTVCIIFVVIWIREFNHADPDRIHTSTGTGVKLS